MASISLNFHGKVAVITGAGGGIGRSYALELARRGANVVVNDLGGSFLGEGKGNQLADKVVDEIVSAGGSAVANYDSVEDGDKIIDSAIKSYGKVDILVNNAGILRDKSFTKMTESDWEKVLRVHLHGSFKVTKAAWPYMQKQKYGRIIMTTSPSGLYGNFGQTNYSAAKMALVGFANSLSIEGRKKNIFVNTIAPVAETRMTKDIMPSVGFLPEHIMPFVVYMCHDSFLETGVILETLGGYACRTKLQRSEGTQVRQCLTENATVESVADAWDRITNFNDDSSPDDINTTAQIALNTLETLPMNPLPENASLEDRIKAHPLPITSRTITPDDAILYALSIGSDLPNDYKYLYEGHEDFSTFPTYAAVLGQGTLFGMLMGPSDLPGQDKINFSNVVHGEQYTELFSPLPTSGKVTSKGRIVDIIDKRRFCQFIVESELFDSQGEKIARNQFVVLFLGTRGVGRKGKSNLQIPSLAPPHRPPDSTYEEKTKVNQAALYRLTGDKNPLHIDPDFATNVGFDQPIIHGLCSYGISVRHVLKKYANDDASLFKCVKAQFSKPVIPGQTLVTEMWAEGSRIHFRGRVKETNEIVLKGAYLDLHQKAKVDPVGLSIGKAVNTSSTGMLNCVKASNMFEKVQSRAEATSYIGDKLKGLFLWQITKANKVAGEWLMNCNSSPLRITPAHTQVNPDVTLKIDDDVFPDIVNKKMNISTAFRTGQLKGDGKMTLTKHLGNIFDTSFSKL